MIKTCESKDSRDFNEINEHLRVNDQRMLDYFWKLNVQFGLLFFSLRFLGLEYFID